MRAHERACANTWGRGRNGRKINLIGGYSIVDTGQLISERTGTQINNQEFLILIQIGVIFRNRGFREFRIELKRLYDTLLGTISWLQGWLIEGQREKKKPLIWAVLTVMGLVNFSLLIFYFLTVSFNLSVGSPAQQDIIGMSEMQSFIFSPFSGGFPSNPIQKVLHLVRVFTIIYKKYGPFMLIWYLQPGFLSEKGIIPFFCETYFQNIL